MKRRQMQGFALLLALFAFIAQPSAWAVALLDRDAFPSGLSTAQPTPIDLRRPSPPLHSKIDTAAGSSTSPKAQAESYFLEVKLQPFDQYTSANAGPMNAVPEPSTALLVGLGLGSLAVWRLKKGKVS